MPFVVALTGGIGSGKTTVANLFHHHFNIELIDADIIAREVVEPGTEGLAKIIDHFGSSILTEQGKLDRSALRSKVFTHPEDKAWLNQLLHPLIRERMKQALDKISSPYALLVVPLLVENKLQSMADRIVVVDVSEEVQIQRTIQRDNVPIDQVRAILSSQATREQRLSYADDVIINDDNNLELLPQVTELHHKYIAICENRSQNETEEKVRSRNDNS